MAGSSAAAWGNHGHLYANDRVENESVTAQVCKEEVWKHIAQPPTKKTGILFCLASLVCS